MYFWVWRWYHILLVPHCCCFHVSLYFYFKNCNIFKCIPPYTITFFLLLWLSTNFLNTPLYSQNLALILQLLCSQLFQASSGDKNSHKCDMFNSTDSYFITLWSPVVFLPINCNFSECSFLTLSPISATSPKISIINILIWLPAPSWIDQVHYFIQNILKLPINWSIYMMAISSILIELITHCPTL